MAEYNKLLRVESPLQPSVAGSKGVRLTYLDETTGALTVLRVEVPDEDYGDSNEWQSIICAADGAFDFCE